MSADTETVTVESIYGAKSDAPYVKLSVGGTDWLLPPEKARQIAIWLLEAAEAAYTDAFLLRWVMANMPVTREQVAPLIHDLRQFREMQRRSGQEYEEADQARWRDQAPPA